MNRVAGSRAGGLRALAVVAVYGLVLSAEPILHHDFFCHHHSPSHCVSCLSSQSAPEAKPATEALTTRLALVGTLEALSVPIVETLTSAPTPGRSPPA